MIMTATEDEREDSQGCTGLPAQTPASGKTD